MVPGIAINPGDAGQMYLPYVGRKYTKLLSMKDGMHFEIPAWILQNRKSVKIPIGSRPVSCYTKSIAGAVSYCRLYRIITGDVKAGLDVRDNRYGEGTGIAPINECSPNSGLQNGG